MTEKEHQPVTKANYQWITSILNTLIHLNVYILKRVGCYLESSNDILYLPYRYYNQILSFLSQYWINPFLNWSLASS